MELNRKDIYVAVGYLTDTPLSINYESVVSRDSVCLALLIVELNYLDILSGDIHNAYLNTLTK